MPFPGVFSNNSLYICHEKNGMLADIQRKNARVAFDMSVKIW